MTCTKSHKTKSDRDAGRDDVITIGDVKFSGHGARLQYAGKPWTPFNDETFDAFRSELQLKAVDPDGKPWGIDLPRSAVVLATLAAAGIPRKDILMFAVVSGEHPLDGTFSDTEELIWRRSMDLLSTDERHRLFTGMRIEELDWILNERLALEAQPAGPAQ